MTFDYFERTVVINRDARPDRMDLFEHRSKQAGISATRFSAIEVNGEPPKRYQIGCMMSHQEIVKQAKVDGLSNVLIFEDDCVFADDFMEYGQKCVHELKSMDWDLFYLGGEPNYECFRVSSHLFQCNRGIYMTHAYALNRRFFDCLLASDPK